VLSPDERLLAYDSDRDGTRGVYVARADGRDARRVSGPGYAAAPRWSPDGRKLAFVKAEEHNARVWNVWVLDRPTGELTRVSSHKVGQAWAPSWFPDATRIAYSVEDRLVIVNTKTGGARVIPSPLRGHLLRTPAVSPDGREIVFQVHGDGVWLLDVPTGRARRLLADRSAEEFAWTSDGRAIAYHARRGAGWSLWQVSVPPAAG
jgi:Tol biopolymer transport system component